MTWWWHQAAPRERRLPAGTVEWPSTTVEAGRYSLVARPIIPPISLTVEANSHAHALSQCWRRTCGRGIVSKAAGVDWGGGVMGLRER